MTRPLRHRRPPRAGARRVGGVGGPVPRGRQRRGGPRPRRLPRPAAGRARPERRRRRRPRRGARAGCARRWPAASCAPPTPARRWTPPACESLWPRCGPRPSATRRARVGRFGVGFAAVLAVSDEPAVLCATGGVAVQRRPRRAPRSPRCPGSPTSWPPRRARPGAAAAVAGRGRRRPTATTTEVVLPLRDAAPRPSVEPLLAGARRRPAARPARPGRDRVVGTAAPHAVPRGRPDGVVDRPTTARRPLAGRPALRRRWPPSCSPTGRSRSGPGAAGR